MQDLLGLITASLQVAAAHPHATEIYQSDANYLTQSDRFGYLTDAATQVRKTWLRLIEDGVASRAFRSDVDPGTAYQLMRDAIWLAVRWHRPAPGYSPAKFAADCTSLPGRAGRPLTFRLARLACCAD